MSELHKACGHPWSDHNANGCTDMYCHCKVPGELKNQELPPLEGVELYMQKAREFLANSAKMDDAPIPWMIAAAFKNEAENKRLRAELKAKDTELAAAESKWNYANKVVQNQYAELAAKDARIAELEQRCNTFMQGLEAEEEDCEALHAKLEAAEKSLGAVSEALKEKLPGYPPEFGKPFEYYRALDIDGLLARLRSIVEGNHAK